MSAIINRDRAGQIIDFTGIRYRTITPTDIDGFMEYHNKAFSFFEMKMDGAPLPQGQILAITRLCDALNKSGKEAALFICRHNVKDAKQDIRAEKTRVESIYYRGKWSRYPGGGGTLGNWLNKWLEFACPEALQK